jgi:hypothetical protein
MAQRKPATDIPRDVVDEDKPECNASAGIEPNVSVWYIIEWAHRDCSEYFRPPILFP